MQRRDFLVQTAAGVALLSGSAQVGAAERQPRPALAASDLRAKLQQCLGGPWPEPCDLKPIVRETKQKEGYRLESVTYEVEPGDRVPAFVLVPDGVSASQPAPAVAVWHQHNGAYHLGKVEPAGLAGSPMHHTGVALAKLGYVVICPDALCFGERQSKHLQGGNFERFEFLRYVVAGKCMAWKNILDMRRAIDYLCSRPEVCKERIGCYGHSMGSTHTWLVGPWEPRLKCLVGNCCLPTYAAIHRTHILHCFPNFIPGWFQYGDTPDIAGLIAPRALHLNLGETDGGSPIEEVREGVKTIARAYERAGVPDKFSYFIEPGTGHVLSDEMWRRARERFEKHLKT
jgi:dienelactone hydrolase